MTLGKDTIVKKGEKRKSKQEVVKSKKAKLTEIEKEREIEPGERKKKKPTHKINAKKRSDSCGHDEKPGGDQKQAVPSKESPAKDTKKKSKKQNKKNKIGNGSKKDTDELPGFDHVPSDSEEEEEKNKQVMNSNEKRLYTDFTVNTIFVGNLPLNYDKKKIIKLFSKFGKVVCARIRCIPIANINMRKKVAAIKKEFNPKRNSLVAYVKFESGDSVQKAVEANGMVLDGHHLRIDNAEESEERDVNKAIFVGGLPFDIEDDELWEFFEKCGKIRSVRVIRDSHTTMGKGIGYVNFESTTAVELALQMNGQELKKRCINVKRCLNTVKKNKMKSFGKKKTKEMVGELLSKKNQTKLKMKKKERKSTQQSNLEFLGTKATVKKKKKKKLNQDILRKKKIVKILKK